MHLLLAVKCMTLGSAQTLEERPIGWIPNVDECVAFIRICGMRKTRKERAKCVKNPRMRRAIRGYHEVQ
jgi:hypothetical protein